MEAKFLLQNTIPFSSQQRRKCMHKREQRPKFIHAVVTTPMDNIAEGGVTVESTSTVQKDNWFDRIAINHLSQSVQAVTGLKNSMSGYESLVEAASMVSRNFNPIQQRELVTQSLQKAFPAPIMLLIKTLMPDSKIAREYFAVFTTLFFAWLVGPCEVRESEFNGRMEKNVVHIKKCRFLEESNCAGMCTNLCKFPSQAFVKDSLGMPVNMVPNFDDMSCEMVFGQEPPAPAHDPALKQPCYKLCKVSQKHSATCTN